MSGNYSDLYMSLQHQVICKICAGPGFGFFLVKTQQILIDSWNR